MHDFSIESMSMSFSVSDLQLAGLARRLTALEIPCFPKGVEPLPLCSHGATLVKTQ